MNIKEVTKILFKIRGNLIDPKQKHAIWVAIKAIKYCSIITKSIKNRENSILVSLIFS